MKKIVTLIFLCSLVIGGVYYINKSGQKSNIEKVKIERGKERDKVIFRNIDNEEVFLLSLKYNLEKDKIYSLINEYSLLVFGYADDFDYKPDSNDEIIEVSVAIDNLSKKYDISKEAIANILLDKKALESKSSN